MSSGFKDYFRNYIKKRFHIRSADEIRLSGEDLAGLYNPYYARMSDIFHVAGFASAALLVVFILGAVIFNIKSVTYENFYYFIKDFDAVVSADDYASLSVIYSYEDNRTYAGYKGGLVTAGKSSVSVYSATGRKTATYYTGYSDPVIRSSLKYFLIYNRNGNEFSVYNSFARLYSETLEEPILAAVICDNGNFAILTSGSEYKSVIYRYNQNFEKSSAYYYNDYVTSMNLTSDGKYLAVAPAGTADGSLSSRLLTYKEKSEEPSTLTDGIPGLVVACGIKTETTLTEKLYYNYIGGEKILLKGREDNPKELSLAGGVSLITAASDSSGLAAVLSDSAGYLLYYIPYKGEPVSIRLDGEPDHLKISGSMVYILFPDSITRYNISAGTFDKKSCAAGAEDIIISSGDYVFVCYASRAVSIGY